MSTRTQREAIADYLRRGYSITPLEALTMFGCMRLGARVWELKRDGMDIDCEMVETPTGKRVARYSLGFKLVSELVA